MSLFKKLSKNAIVRNTFWSSFGNSFLTLISFIASIFVIRNLAASEYGKLQEAFAYFVILQQTENLVNPPQFKKYLINNPHESESLISNYGLFILIIGITLILLVLGAYVVSGFEPHFLLLAILLMAQPFRFTNGITLYFDANLESKKTQISLNSGNTLSNICKVVFSYLSPLALWQTLTQPIQYATAACIHLYQYKRGGASFRMADWNFKPLFSLISQCFPIFLATICEVARSRVAFIIIGAALGEEALGVFAVGAKFNEPWIFIASAIGISFWPRLVKCRSENPESYQSELHIFFGITFYIFLIFALGGFLFGDWIIPLLAKEKYVASVFVYKILALVLLCQALESSYVLGEINEGAFRHSLARNLFGLVLSGALVYLGLLWNGVDGASIGVLLASFTVVFIWPLFFRRTRKLAVALWTSPFAFPVSALKKRRSLR
ncbi:MAG: oligosaccharide flippase family protein [Pseudobdellovibrionaceae bacterium]